jgi:hypothetical protein
VGFSAADPGDQCLVAGAVTDRRARAAQRDAVEHVLPEDAGSVLRMAGGEVIVYAEQDHKRRPVRPVAVVLPDGDRIELETGRFRRR